MTVQKVSVKKGRITIPHTMKYNNIESSDGQGISELFSVYFGSVFDRPTDRNGLISDMPVVSDFTLSNIVLGEQDVLIKLKQLDGHKGAGPDGIPPVFLKNCAKELSSPLTFIFNRSLASGIFPTLWKMAYIVPIFKSGDKCSCTNYRPISILSCLAKVFESLVYTHLYNHLSRFISDKQHGFVRKRSTLSNLLEFKNYLCQVFASGGQVESIYLDFSKAFDKVDHYLLCNKLAYYGVHGCLFRWVTCYLENRTQLVTVKGHCSLPMPVTSGVPQGSHLGPLLFIIFINDLVNRISCNTLLYADDMKIFTSVRGDEDCVELQNDLRTVSEWCVYNKMKLNIEKCCMISFTRKKNILHYTYNINDKNLSRRSVVRDLGVLIDEQLTFRSHYDTITKRSRQLLGFLIRSTRDFKNPRSILTLFLSLVRSILEYCSPIWSPYYYVHVNSIDRIQIKCLKFIYRKYFFGRSFQNYEQRLSKLNLLSLRTRRMRYDLLCLHKVLHSYIDAPGLLSSLRINTHHRIRCPKIFAMEVHKNNTSYYNPLVRMCRTYNDIACGSNDAGFDVFDGNFPAYKRNVTKYIEQDVLSPGSIFLSR